MKEIRDTKSQLKDVNNLLKLDPGNTDLLAQKQRVLSQSVSETKEKLDALKLAGQQANDALAREEISQSQYDALTAIGMTASESGHFADILAAASSNANTNVAMMGETFKYCVPVVGALGFSAADTAEAIGLMANADLKSSQAGTAMRTMLTSLTGDVTFVGDSFGELTVQTVKTDGSMRSLGDTMRDCRAAFSQMTDSEKAANAEALAGKNAMSGFLAVMNAASGDIQKLNGVISNCDGTAEKMAATMQDNLAGQLTILKSQPEELAISIGEILMPSIRQIVGWIQGLVDWLNGLDEGTKKTIVTIALVAAAVVAAIGWIPLAIAAVVAIIVVLWNKCDWFREAVIAVWETIKSATIAAWNAVKGFLVNLWSWIVETGKTVWNGLASFFTSCWQGIQNMFTTVLTAIGTAIQTFLTTVWNAIKVVITTVLTVIQMVFTAVWNAIKNVVTMVVGAIQSFITAAWNGIRAVSGV